MFRRTFLASLAAPGGALAAPPARPVLVRAWWGPADRVHGHDALGTGSYPGRVHGTVREGAREYEVALELPPDAAFEDGLLRLADLDADGSPELVLVTASRTAGAAIVVLGLERRGDGDAMLVEQARSPAVGRGRWLNPVGMADFDGDGRQEVVAVATPHIGGVLTLYRVQPPHLVPIASERNVSNHAYGEREQQLAAVLTRQGRPVVAIPDQGRRRLRFLAPTSHGGWQAVAAEVVFDDPIERVRSADGRRLEVRAGTRSWRSD